MALLANGPSTFPIKGNLVFSNSSKSLPKILPIVQFYVMEFFDYFILTEELFEKTLRSFETCVLVNNNLCGILFSLLESLTTFDERHKVTLVPFFITDFNLVSC